MAAIRQASSTVTHPCVCTSYCAAPQALPPNSLMPERTRSCQGRIAAVLCCFAHLGAPLCHLGVIDQELGHVQIWCHGHTQPRASATQVALQQQLPEGLVEGTQVRDKAGYHCAVPCEGIRWQSAL